MATGSETSATLTSSFGLDLCCSRLRGLPDAMLSTTRTVRPRASSRSVKWEPMNRLRR